MIAVGRKNWLFAGSDQGGARAAGVLSLTHIADHPINRIGDLLPWSITATARDTLTGRLRQTGGTEGANR